MAINFSVLSDTLQAVSYTHLYLNSFENRLKNRFGKIKPVEVPFSCSASGLSSPFPAGGSGLSVGSSLGSVVGSAVGSVAVSYTHLDVYKRQVLHGKQVEEINERGGAHA